MKRILQYSIAILSSVLIFYGNGVAQCGGTVNITALGNGINTTELNCNVTSITLTASCTGCIGSPIIDWGGGATSVTVNTASTHTVTVTDDSGSCTESITITQDILAPTASIAPPNELTCTNMTVGLDGSGSTGQGTLSLVWSSGTPSVTTPGDYTLEVTDSDNGCTAETTVTVTQDILAPTASIAPPNELTCTNMTVGLDGSGSTGQGTLSLVWSSGTPSVTTPGDYTLEVTDSDNGCTAETTVTVTQDILAPTALIAPPNELTCTNTTVTLNGGSSTGQVALTYDWSNNLSGSTTSVTMGGSYSLTVTDTDNGCTDTASTTVSMNGTVPTATITGNELLTCSNTSISLAATNPVVQGGASYMWSVGAPSVVNPGTYTVTITDSANGCTGTEDVTVLQNIISPSATISGNELLTCINNSVSLTTTNPVVQGGASYMWSAGAPSVVNPGTYTVTITDSANGCTGIESAVVSQNTTAPSVSIGGNELLTCSNTSIQLSTLNPMVQGGASYMWSVGAPSVVSPGTYTVTITDSFNGCTESESVTVSQNITAPSVSIGGNELLTCSNTSAQLSTLNPIVQGGASYMWSVGAPSVVSPGTYTVTITDSFNGCTEAESVTVSQNITAPSVSIGGNELLTCSNTSTQLSTLNPMVQGGASYMWSVGAPSVVSPGTYTVTIMDSFNDCTGVESVNVLQNITPPSISIPTPSPICDGETVSLVSTTSSNIASYSWSGQGTSSNQSSTSVTGLAPSTLPYPYTVTVIDADNGCNNSAQTSVIVNENPVFDETTFTDNAGNTGNQANDNVLCNGATLSINPTAIYSNSSCVNCTFNWGNIATSSYQVSPSQNTTYPVTVTDTNGCSTTSALAIIVNSNPTAAISAIDNTGVAINDGVVCQGDALTLSAGNSTGGSGSTIDTYTWSSGLGSGSTASILTNSSNTTSYSVIVEDGNGCTQQVSQNITVNALPVPDIIVNESSGLAENDGVICSGDEVVLTAIGGQLYNWGNGSTSNPILQLPNQTNDFFVTVTDNNNCSSNDIENIIVHNPPTAIITEGPFNSIFVNEPLRYIANESTMGTGIISQYNWSFFPGATNQSDTGVGPVETTPTQEGEFNVVLEITDQNGCIDQDNLSFDVFTDLNCSLGSINVSESKICHNSNILFTVAAMPSDSGSDILDWNWNFGDGTTSTEETPSHTFMNTGLTAIERTVEVFYTQDLGFGEECISNTSTIIITVYPQPNVTIQVNDTDNVFCEGEDISILFTNIPEGSYDIITNFGNFEGILNGNIRILDEDFIGFNNLVVTSISNPITGCVNNDLNSDASTTITINENPIVDDITTNCAADNQTYSVSFDIEGGNPPYFLGGQNIGSVNTYTVSNIPSGETYMATLRDSRNCFSETIEAFRDCADCGVYQAITMSSEIIESCEDASFEITELPNGIGNIDSDWVIEYHLHEGSGNSLVNSISTISVSSNFTEIPVFNFNSSLSFGQTYYISAVISNPDSDGSPDADNPCYTVVQGQPIVFYQTPQITLSLVDSEVCEGEAVIVEFTGMQNDITYTLDTDFSTEPLSVSTTNTTYSIDLGLLNLGQNILTINTIENNQTGCRNTSPNQSVMVTINENPEIIETEVSEDCNSSNTAYTVSFPISEGMGSYMVVSENGIIQGDFFTSDENPSGASYMYIIEDVNTCKDTLQGMFDCECDNTDDEPSFSSPEIAIEECESNLGSFFVNAVNVNNIEGDSILYQLHDGTSTSVGNIITETLMGSNSAPSFSISSDDMIVFGQPYFIHVVIAAINENNIFAPSEDNCKRETLVDKQIIFYKTPTITLFEAESDEICQGDSIQINIQPESSGATVTASWNINGDNEDIGIPLDTTIAFNNSWQDEILFNITQLVDDEFGCSNDTISANNFLDVSINPLPNPQIEGLTNLCEGGELNLQITEDFESYSWSFNNVELNGETTNSLIGVQENQSGTYSVLVTDENECKNDTEVSVTVNPIPTPIITGDIEPCNNQYGEIYNLEIVNSEWNYTWEIEEGEIIGSNTEEQVQVYWNQGATTSASVFVEVETTPNIANDGCEGSFELPIEVSTDTALDTTEVILFYEIDESGLRSKHFLMIADTATCYAWGNGNSSEVLSTKRTYYLGPDGPSGNDDFWVDRWNGDCEAGNPCSQRSYYKSKENPVFVESEPLAFEVYPNPTNGNVFLRITSPEAKQSFDVSIYDLNGRKLVAELVGFKDGFWEGEINLEQLSRGYYLLMMQEQTTGERWYEPLIVKP